VRQGTPINRIDEFGRTALNAAVRANSLVLVKKLLAYGARLDQKDGSGITALQTAQRFKRQSIEKFLVHYALDHGRKKMIASNTPTGRASSPASTDPLQMLRQP
jgi:ankyrin repeat protein